MFREEQDFNFSMVIGFIDRHKWPLLIMTLAAGILAAVFSGPAFITPKFKSSAVVFASTTSSLGSSINTTPGYEKENITQLGEEEEAEQLLQLLKSEDIKSRIVQKYDLMRHYDIGDATYPMTALEREWNSNVKIARTEHMSVVVEVLDHNPDTAAMIANDIVKLVDTVRFKAQQPRTYGALMVAEAKLKEKNDLIANLVDSLQKIGEMGVYSPEDQVGPLSEAYAAAMRNSSTKPSVIAELREQQINMGKYGPIHKSLTQKLEYESEELTKLKAKVEQARVNAEEILQTTFVVNSAYPAERKSYPVRWLIVVITMMATLAFGVLLFAILDSVKAYRKDSRIAVMAPEESHQVRPRVYEEV